MIKDFTIRKESLHYDFIMQQHHKDFRNGYDSFRLLFSYRRTGKSGDVGPNGAGKSTLLKIIMGRLPADDGTVTISKDKTLGYLAQHQNLSSDGKFMTNCFP